METISTKPKTFASNQVARHFATGNEVMQACNPLSDLHMASSSGSSISTPQQRSNTARTRGLAVHHDEHDDLSGFPRVSDPVQPSYERLLESQLDVVAKYDVSKYIQKSKDTWTARERLRATWMPGTEAVPAIGGMDNKDCKFIASIKDQDLYINEINRCKNSEAPPANVMMLHYWNEARERDGIEDELPARTYLVCLVGDNLDPTIYKELQRLSHLEADQSVYGMIFASDQTGDKTKRIPVAEATRRMYGGSPSTWAPDGTMLRHGHAGNLGDVTATVLEGKLTLVFERKGVASARPPSYYPTRQVQSLPHSADSAWQNASTSYLL